MVRRGRSRLSYRAPHQRLKFPKSYLIAATGGQNFSKGRVKSRIKKEMNSAINSLVF